MSCGALVDRRRGEEREGGGEVGEKLAIGGHLHTNFVRARPTPAAFSRYRRVLLTFPPATSAATARR